MNFETHHGPLIAGDLIVIEINGRLVPKPSNDLTPQWFVVLKDQIAKEEVPLKPFNEPTKGNIARKYVALLGY